MDFANTLARGNAPTEGVTSTTDKYSFISKYSPKNERQILKTFLLTSFREVFSKMFFIETKKDQNDSSLEQYEMDNKIIQSLIYGIVETGQYTLEGISYYTRIPFDVIYEAAYGVSKEFTITLWARVVDLYLQVRPDVEEILIEKLLELKNKSCSAFSVLLAEK